MIPEHLQGKCAVQIVDEQRDRFISEPYNDVDERVAKRIKQLERMLLIATTHALMNADGKVLCDGDYGLMGSEAEGRAIAFLNIVLPYEEKNGN